jgi:hypothetical protein
MKTIYTLACSILGLTILNSCSVYKNNPTPDDVYYSQGKQQQTADNNSDYYSTPNENYVKMRVQDPSRWSYFDDYDYDYYAGNYGYSPYYSGVGLSIGFGMGYCPYYGGFGYYSPLSYMNSYYAWNNFYNPYYGHVVVINGKNTETPSYTRMSSFNPTAYKGRYYNTRPSVTRVSTFNSYYSGNSNSNSNIFRSNNYRPAFSNSPQPGHTSTSGFGGGGSSIGGGGSRGGGFSRPSR